MNRPSSIYVFEFSRNRAIKVGMSISPEKRAAHVLVSARKAFGHGTLHLVYKSKPIADAREAEATVHETLFRSGHHIAHEWFSAPAQVAIDLIDRCVDDPSFRVRSDRYMSAIRGAGAEKKYIAQAIAKERAKLIVAEVRDLHSGRKTMAHASREARHVLMEIDMADRELGIRIAMGDMALKPLMEMVDTIRSEYRCEDIMTDEARLAVVYALDAFSVQVAQPVQPKLWSSAYVLDVGIITGD